jgi:glycogen phosphorylase
MSLQAEVQSLIEDDRTGLSIATLRRAFADNLFYLQGKYPSFATQNDLYMALAYTVRDRLLQRWLKTKETYFQQGVRMVSYLSAEFLLGPHLGHNLINLGIEMQVRQAVEDAGLDLQILMAQEEEPGLGNGGLGRLAACYLDSLATLEIPAIGYGIRYEFGIFDQLIRDGWQVEVTDKWLQNGNPWELIRPELAVTVKFGGRTETYCDDQGQPRCRWLASQWVKGVPYDTPILGYRVNTANTLRLWKAEADQAFDFQTFNIGDYYGAVNDKVVSENLTKVLYPNDEPIQGKQLRLEQQYFFVSCSLQDMIRIHLRSGCSIKMFDQKFAIQLNDTHPAIAVAELMRLLVDEHDLAWTVAWEITQNTFGYTNHTLLPEALEQWPLGLFGSLLPRHLEIIFEINQRFLDQVRMKYSVEGDRPQKLSLIDESGERYIRMAALACVGSHAVNGVAELHTQLLEETVLQDFYQFFPQKFCNVTNGVTPRRWLLLSNPGLSALITHRIGVDWVTHLEQLRRLEDFVNDSHFCQEWQQAKSANKCRLTEIIHQQTGITVDPSSLFDVQSKRIHEYKRQHLNILHVITLYNRLKQNPCLDIPPRTVIFAGKAAPGYTMAKLIIKLITSVGDLINHDPEVGDRLKVVFLPDYNVKNSQPIYPAADLSEQISTAGKEASGTGNMKFSLNGALTIGTLDGANIEIRTEVGEDNFFLFGLNAPQVLKLQTQGYTPRHYYNTDPELKQAIDQIRSGHFSHGDCQLFLPLTEGLLEHDPFMVLADYRAYLDCQDQVNAAYSDQAHWTRMSILNTARMGKFSSDRAIRDYNQRIWKVPAVRVSLDQYSPNQDILLGACSLD